MKYIFRKIIEFCLVYHRKNGTRRNIEGLGSAEKPPNWTVIDLGNIVVHTMVESIRAKYDLETLWALGPEFDLENRKFSEEHQEEILGIVPPHKEERHKDWAFFE